MPAPDLTNAVIGACYRILRPLGEGGMGTVYEAQHLRLGTPVAIKILSPQHAVDPKARDRFKREAKAASQIRHPNVVQIIDFGETPQGSVFFAMELLEGQDLHAILRRHAPLPWRRVQNLLAQAADALAAAHARGIVHRDIKPGNVFVLQSEGVHDFVKILDFGIAKILAPDLSTNDSTLIKNLTGTGEVFGTAKYMAPEQAYGSSDDPRVDIYGLGVVAYEMLTGRVPFSADSAFEIITKHVYETPRPPRELQPSIPAELEAVVLRALAKKADDRYSTMEELGRALRAIDDRAEGPSTGRGGTLILRRHSGTVPSPAAAPINTEANTLLRPREPQHPQVQPSVPPPVPHAAAEPTRDQAVATPRSSGRRRLGMFVALAAICVSALSATGAYLAIGPSTEPLTEHESALPPPRPNTTKPPKDDASPSHTLGPSATARPTRATHPPFAPTPEPPPDPDQGRVDPLPPDVGRTTETPPPRPTATKPRPSPSRPPKSDEQIVADLSRKSKRKCSSLGKGKRVAFALHVSEQGHMDSLALDAKGPLESCLRRAVGRPSFPPRAKGQTIKFSKVIGSGSVDPFSTASR